MTVTMDSGLKTQDAGLESAADAATTKRTIHSYADIEAFQRAMKLLRPLHALALKLPDYEKFDLASQLRRASKSIPTNVAEGYGKRRSSRQFRAYVENAIGSADEVVVHLQIARELEYAPDTTVDTLIAEYRIVGKMLNRLIEKSRW